MSFCLKTPKWEFEIPKVGTLTTLGAHNFMYRPPIEMRFPTVTLVESFPTVCDTPPAHKEIGAISDL